MNDNNTNSSARRVNPPGIGSVSYDANGRGVDEGFFATVTAITDGGENPELMLTLLKSPFGSLNLLLPRREFEYVNLGTQVFIEVAFKDVRPHRSVH